ncbi:MAG: hypothetical protein R3B41_00270 [Candidatus Doudnabacteria bacterium]
MKTRIIYGAISLSVIALAVGLVFEQSVSNPNLAEWVKEYNLLASQKVPVSWYQDQGQVLGVQSESDQFAQSPNKKFIVKFDDAGFDPSAIILNSGDQLLIQNHSSGKFWPFNEQSLRLTRPLLPGQQVEVDAFDLDRYKIVNLNNYNQVLNVVVDYSR